jgi:hypothetical protein
MKQTIEIEVPDVYKAMYDEDIQEVEVVNPTLPKTWEEFCDNFPFKKGECVISYYGTIENVEAEERYKQSGNVLPNEETAEAFVALMQLVQLRDCYRQGWKPDWKDGTEKYVIVQYNNVLSYEVCQKISRVLAFQSVEVRNEFLNNFKDLVEQAKELI